MWPQAHLRFLDHALPSLQKEPALLGVAAGGSAASRTLDQYSDLDLLLVCAPEKLSDLFVERERLAKSLGNFLAGFTGEHVGEPRLYITLFDDPLLHVDFTFLNAEEFGKVGATEILWEKEGALQAAAGTSHPEHPDLQWIEDRFWIWVHYGAQRIGRGEIFEAIDHLSFLRSRVIGPLLQWQKGLPPRGARRLEALDYQREARATVPIYDARSCELSLKETAKLYVELRELKAQPDLVRQRRAEMAAMRYLHQVSEGL